MQNDRAPSRFDVARVRPDVRTGMRNGGWAFDTYPEMPRLLAGAEMEVGYVKGPGVITQLHTTAHCWLHADPVKRAEIARGLVLLIYYNDSPEPAVQVPMADFFADGCGGRAVDFSSVCVEKGPETYNATFLMPFEHSVRVVVRNDTGTDIDNYFFFEYELLPEWDPGLGYFHATWKRFALQATTKTVAPIIQLKGPGHILGHHWSISTDEGMFYDMNWIMEANNEIRIDGEGPEPPGPYKPNQGPAYDYLGTEDSFGFSWGFRRVFCGIWNGMNFIETKTPYQVSLYRFRESNLLRFSKSLDWKLNWTHEFTRPGHEGFRRRVDDREKAGGTWADYATTFYWYQSEPGYAHEPLPSLAERSAVLLHPNPSGIA